jgi:hypothetical protein
MKTHHILLLLASLLIFSCNNDDDKGTPPPTNTSTSFSGTLTDLINGPNSAFMADVIEVLHDTLINRLYVYLEHSGQRTMSFTIAGAVPGQYNLSAVSLNEAFLLRCDTISNDLTTQPNDAGLASEVLGTISIDTYDVAAGRLSLTISSLTFVSVGPGASDDVEELSLTNATLTNAPVAKTAVGLNYLASPSINCLVNGNPFNPTFVSVGSEVSNTIFSSGAGGVLDLILPLNPAEGQYDLAVEGDGYGVAYNVNDLNSFAANEGNLIVKQSCDGHFYGTFEASVDISTSTVSIEQGRFALQVQ